MRITFPKTTFIIGTTCATLAEAHQLGEGITCALDGARVVRTYERILRGETFSVVAIEVPEEYEEHVCALLDDDDRVVAY